MNTKAKGSARELKTIRRLEAEGYSCTKSAASLGVWDIIALRQDGIRLIQVKSNRWPGTVEMENMREFREPPGATKEVWRWDDRAKHPKVKLL